MAQLIIGNVYTEVVGRTGQVENLLRFRPAGYTFSPKYKKRQWDGWISLCRHKGDQLFIPSGLVSLVREKFPGDYDVPNQRDIPPQMVGVVSPIQAVELDPAQLEAVEAAIKETRGIIQYPTGVGKARIIGETIRRLNVRTLVLCDKRDLLYQLQHEIANAVGNEDVGIVGDEHSDFRDITVATYQSIIARLDDSPKAMLEILTRAHCVIVDETHHATADGLRKILGNMPNAYYRLGYSATAFKGYKGATSDLGTFLGVQAFLGPPISTMTISEGVETGRIVRANVFMVHGCEWEGKAINYTDELNLGIVNNKQRNATVATLISKLNSLGPTVVLVSREEHGEQFAVAGVPFINGKTPSKLRKKYYTEFKNGERNCLVIGKLGDEALDLPNIRYLILAGGGNAPHVQIQRIGRGMRASEGKDVVDVFDFVDYGKYISSHSRRRLRTYEKEPAYTVIPLTKAEILGL